MDPRVEQLVEQIRSGSATPTALAFCSKSARGRALAQADEAFGGDPASLQRILPLLGFTSQAQVDAIRECDLPDQPVVVPAMPVCAVDNPVRVWYRDHRGLRHVGEIVHVSVYHITVRLFDDSQYGDDDDETPFACCRPTGRTREFAINGSSGEWVDANGFPLRVKL